MSNIYIYAICYSKKYVNVVSLLLMLLIVVARWGTAGIVTGVAVPWLSALDLNICIIFGMELCLEIRDT